MSENETDETFLIAALGASAGGLEPLEKFFKHMPADSGMAFVVVQHLAPDRATALAEILARSTKMPVELVRDNMKATPNRVSIIPPNATLTIKDGAWRVSDPVEARGLRTPIDALSLILNAYQNRCYLILLEFTRGNMARSPFTSSLLILCSLTSAYAQSATNAHHASEQMLREAFREGIEFKTDLVVRNNITAQAVLLPAPVAKRIFGKEIANSYAVIEVNVGNKSRDAAFILHGLFLDYSDWALSGFVKTTDADRVRPSDYDRRDDYRGPRKGPEALAADNQAHTDTSQVASVEYRLARGQLLDAQLWSARNWTVRLLTLAGSMASSYSFSFKEKGLSKGIAAFSGTVVPGIEAAWPDSTVAQLNRISDFGYQTNKVVTREDGEIIVAFFPIDRFLTPGLRKLFLKSPAVFFNPYSILYDTEAMKSFSTVAPNALGMDNTSPAQAKKRQGELLGALPEFLEKVKDAKEPGGAKLNFRTLSTNEKVLYFLSRTSLNTIHIVVDGIMTVDVASIPAKIDTVTFDNETSAATWSEPGDVTGTIRGSFLAGGHVKIAEADTLGITEMATVDKDSNDQVLHFKMKVSKPIDTKKPLTISVVKTDKQGRSFESTAMTYSFPKASPKTEITDVKRAADTVTVTGKDFFTTDDKPLTVSVAAVGSKDAKPVKDFKRTATEISFDPTTLKLDPACYTVTVTPTSVDPVTSAKSFPVLPSLDVTSAITQGKQIVVTGTGFIDLKDCGKALTFQIAEVKSGSEPAPKAVTNLKIESAAEKATATFDLPAQPVNAKWQVSVQLGEQKIVKEVTTK